jgi:hypothetical protein
MQTGTFHDSTRTRLVETRLALINTWTKIADTLDLQGEVQLAGDVRYFARRPEVRCTVPRSWPVATRFRHAQRL